MKIDVKICGLSTPETLDTALAAGATMVGFVRFGKSPRHVSLEALQVLGHQVGGRARMVLLTVDADDEALHAAIAALKPDILQLHGQETPAHIAAVRKRFGLPVMKAIAIGGAADLGRIAEYEEVADLLLLDSRPRDAVALPGGRGEAFDWALLKGFRARKPWLLGGGLTAANVGAAIAATGARGVDVSSGVESTPGTKDPAKIAAFIASVRAAEKLGSAAESG